MLRAEPNLYITEDQEEDWDGPIRERHSVHSKEVVDNYIFEGFCFCF